MGGFIRTAIVLIVLAIPVGIINALANTGPYIVDMLGHVMVVVGLPSAAAMGLWVLYRIVIGTQRVRLETAERIRRIRLEEQREELRFEKMRIDNQQAELNLRLIQFAEGVPPLAYSTVASGALTQQSIRMAHHKIEAQRTYPNVPKTITHLPPSTPIEESAPNLWAEQTLRDSIQQSQPHKWILGQSMEDGTLATFDPFSEVHCAIIGKTGTGKTQSTAMLMMLYAKKFGMDVVVLDGKFGVDWKRWEQIVEWQEMTHQTIIAQLESLTALYMQRVDLIRQHSVSHIDEVDSYQPHVFVMIEEFGAMCAALKATDKKEYNRMEVMLGELFSKARFTGLHICIMDQKPNQWSQTIRANIGSYFAYHISGGVANHIETGLDAVPRVGHFQREGTVYKAWHTTGEIDVSAAMPLHRQQWRVMGVDKAGPQQSGGRGENALTPPP